MTDPSQVPLPPDTQDTNLLPPTQSNTPPSTNATIQPPFVKDAKVKVINVATLDTNKPGIYPKWRYKMKCSIQASCTKASIGKQYIDLWEDDLNRSASYTITQSTPTLMEIDAQVFSAVYCAISGRKEGVITEKVRTELTFGRGLDLLCLLDQYFFMDTEQKRSDVVAQFISLQVQSSEVADMEQFLSDFRRLQEESHLMIPAGKDLPDDFRLLQSAVRAVNAEILAKACRKIHSWSQVHDIWLQLGTHDEAKLFALMERVVIERVFQAEKLRAGRASGKVKQLVSEEIGEVAGIDPSQYVSKYEPETAQAYDAQTSWAPDPSTGYVGHVNAYEHEDMYGYGSYGLDYSPEWYNASDYSDNQCAFKGKDKGKGSKGTAPKGKGKGFGPGTCFRCGAVTHWQDSCPYPPVACQKCGMQGHSAADCWGNWNKGKGKGKAKGKPGQCVFTQNSYGGAVGSHESPENQSDFQ